MFSLMFQEILYFANILCQTVHLPNTWQHFYEPSSMEPSSSVFGGAATTADAAAASIINLRKGVPTTLARSLTAPRPDRPPRRVAGFVAKKTAR